jgi:hypothetical protein
MANAPEPAPTPHLSPAEHAQRADAYFEALQRAFYDPRSGLYLQRRRCGLRHFETLWPFANAWSALTSLASATEVTTNTPVALEALSERTRALFRYADHPRSDGALGFASTVYHPFWSKVALKLVRAGTRYYDDNDWVALALLQQQHLQGGNDSVDLARRVFAFLLTGWCDKPDWAHPGGIRWADAAWSDSRNTCSNGPACEVASGLFLLTGEAECLDWAVRIYEWTRRVLKGEDGLYSDHILPNGIIEPKVWSYNQGSMIGAGVLLHQATGDTSYLEQAVRTASASTVHYADVTTLSAELPAFAAIYFRNLLFLDAIRPDPTFKALAETYAATMWERRRDPVSGLSTPVSSGVNGTAPLLAVEAMLAGSPPRP